MYADDTEVSLASSSVDELVRKKLSANPQKTEYMFIGHPNRTNKITEQEKLKLNGSEIKTSEETDIIGGNYRSRTQLGGLI